MKEYTAIIIDDEKNIREALLALLLLYCPEVSVCGTADSAVEARIILENNKVDIIFLDISMPKEDGFAFLRSIPSINYSVIFVTAYQEYALKALKASAIDYLLKPVNPVELKDAVNKAIYNHELRQNYINTREVYHQSLINLQEHIQSRSTQLTKLTVVEQFGFRIVNVDDLIFMQADSNYTVLHLIGGQKIVATRTLGEFEKLLDANVFFRIHKSTIINLSFLAGYSSYQGNFAELKDGTILSISRRKVIEFRDIVKQFSNTVD